MPLGSGAIHRQVEAQSSEFVQIWGKIKMIYLLVISSLSLLTVSAKLSQTELKTNICTLAYGYYTVFWLFRMNKYKMNRNKNIRKDI